MNVADFIKNELLYATTRYERLRGTAVAHVAYAASDTPEASRYLIGYLEMQRERCVLLIGELTMLAALCGYAGLRGAELQACTDLDAALWRLANGCDLCAIELRYPQAFAPLPELEAA